MTLTRQGLVKVGWRYDPDGNRTYTRSYKVKATQNPEIEHEALVFAALNISVGSVYTPDPGCLCIGSTGGTSTRRDVSTGSYWEWEIDVSWASKSPNAPGGSGGGGGGGAGGSPSGEKNPTLRPPTITVSQEVIQEPAWKTVPDTPGETARAVVNSAKDPILVEYKLGRNVITVEKYYTQFDYGWTRDANRNIGGFLHSRNKDAWTVSRAPWRGFTLAPGAGLITSIDPRESHENGQTYALVTFKILEDSVDADPDGIARPHQAKVIDRGFRELTGTAPNQKPKIIDTQGVPVSEPQFLDGSGRRLSPNAIGTTGVFTLTFKLYPVRVWSKLGSPF